MLLHAFQYLMKMLKKCKHASSLEDLAIWHVYLGSDGMENLMNNIIYVTYTLIVQLYVQCLKYSHRLHQSTAYWYECQNHREQPIMYWLRLDNWYTGKDFIRHKPTDWRATRGSSLEVKELASIKKQNKQPECFLSQSWPFWPLLSSSHLAV